MRKIVFLFLILVLFFASCNKINPSEDIPSYIQIDTQKVVINNPSEEGYNNHGISDAWVYIDGKYQGNYETPSKFPILATGNHRVTIIAGIKTNGIGATREEYPFYEGYTVDTVLPQAGAINLSPTFSYIDNCDIWIEDFQDVNIKLGKQEGMTSDTIIMREENPDRPGDYYGAIYVNSAARIFNASTNPETDPINYYQASRRMFLEMEYKNNQNFWVGMYADGTPYPIERLNISTDWNTIYIDLTPVMKAHPANVYMLFFNVEYNGEHQGEVFLNNVKLVNYE